MIKGLLETALDLAQGLTYDAWQDVTAKINPSQVAYDPVEQTGGDVWEFEGVVNALMYDDKRTREGGIQYNQKMLLVKAANITGVDMKPDTSSEFTDAQGIVWTSQVVSIDPVAITYIFELVS